MTADSTISSMLLAPWFWTSLGEGLKFTIVISVATVVLSFIFGIIVGVARFSKVPVLSQIATVYIEVIRNVPLILLILACFLVGQLQDMTAAITGLTLFTTAIIAEVVRGGLNSISRGQWEAARSQGFNYIQTLQHIVLPQAVVKMIPPIVSQFVTVLKDSSFAMYIGVVELTQRSKILQGEFSDVWQVMTIYLVIALTYFVINFAVSSASRKLQSNLSVGRGTIGQ